MNTLQVSTAKELGLIRCPGCGLTCSAKIPIRAGLRADCPRCGTQLERRRRHSVGRTWALLLAAAILYLPANLLPIMQATEFFSAVDETILSGVVRLWRGGSYDLAIIVFVASIVVPLLKIGSLAALLISVQRRTNWAQRERAKLYRFIDFIGHWSMLDVFVVALLVGLVRFGGFALVLPGGGAVAFAGVVVLTMLASMSFDPRLIWDTPVSGGSVKQVPSAATGMEST